MEIIKFILLVVFNFYVGFYLKILGWNIRNIRKIYI